MSILKPEPCGPADALVPGLDRALLVSAQGVGTTNVDGNLAADVPMTLEALAANGYVSIVGNNIKFLQDGIYEAIGAAGAVVTADVAMASQASGSNVVGVGLPFPVGSQYKVALSGNGAAATTQTYQDETMSTSGGAFVLTFPMHANDTTQVSLLGGSTTFIGDDAGPGDPIEGAEITAYANLWIRYVGPLPEAA